MAEAGTGSEHRVMILHNHTYQKEYQISKDFSDHDVAMSRPGSRGHMPPQFLIMKDMKDHTKYYLPKIRPLSLKMLEIVSGLPILKFFCGTRPPPQPLLTPVIVPT